MLRIVTDHISSAGHLSRREWLRIGGLFGLSTCLPQPVRGENSPARTASPQPPGFGRARSVILVFLSGGQSQLETWDPKPLAPREVRGDFAAISTAVPGIQVTEHLPELAKLADKYTILRSLSHEDLDHGSAVYQTLTGKPHRQQSSNPPPRPTDEPTLAAVLKRVLTAPRSFADAIHVNGPALVPRVLAPGQDGGYLGRDFEPMLIGDVSQGPLAIPGLASQPELPPLRMHERWRLKQSLDQHLGVLDDQIRPREFEHLYERAFGLLDSAGCREAFNLDAEPDTVRDHYGRHRPGQACLLARRLVEAGVPLITVIWNHTNRGQDVAPEDPEAYGWDTHNDLFDVLKQRLLPRFDRTFAALLSDLDERGLLDDTLIVCVGEFGRAPLVAFESNFAGRSPGRKHWAGTYSAVLAGAGVQRGAVVGASDRFGAYPAAQRVGPWDVNATIFSALGIDPAGHFRDTLDRPIPISIGTPIESLYG